MILLDLVEQWARTVVAGWGGKRLGICKGKFDARPASVRLARVQGLNGLCELGRQSIQEGHREEVPSWGSLRGTLEFRMVNDEIHYRILRELERDPKLSQRQLADALGVSVGKANYCVRALVEKGLLTVENFRRSQNKLAYAYQLTPQGIAAKGRITRRYLEIKKREYEMLRVQIAELESEVGE